MSAADRAPPPALLPLRRRAAWLAWLLALLVSAVAGCATIDVSKIERTASTADRHPETTRLGRAIVATAQAKTGRSGFRLLDNGLDALAARLALIDAAERTLDLQYYIVHGATSTVVIDRLVAAADRGVRVRLLIDDTASFGREGLFAAIDGHRNIEVRAFNPFIMRGPVYVTQALEFLVRGAQLTRRMHNKAFIADNAYAIVGGRNIGDEYFGAEGPLDFQDLDVLAAGPIVKQVSASFDRYWQSELALPFSALGPPTSEEARREAREHVAKVREAELAKPYGQKLREAAIGREIATGRVAFEWARASVWADEPEKAEARVVPVGDSPLARSIQEAMAGVRESLFVISSYFIPGDEGMRALREARSRKAEVGVLTNSLASTDTLPAHSGYAPYREPLLEMGVLLYELRPGPGAEKETPGGIAQSGSKASLHAKAMVFDRRYLVVGSLNFDPRSLKLNTETDLLIDSPALAKRVLDQFAFATKPENAWRVTLVDGRLQWSGSENGRIVVWHHEPQASAARRLAADLVRLLPIKNQL